MSRLASSRVVFTAYETDRCRDILALRHMATPLAYFVSALDLPSETAAEGRAAHQVARDSKRVFHRQRCRGNDDDTGPVLVVAPATRQPKPAILVRLACEYGLKNAPTMLRAHDPRRAQRIASHGERSWRW